MNHDTQSVIGVANSGAISKDVGGSIKNLSSFANLAKSKMLNLAKSKMSDFAKINSSGVDFFTLETKMTFIFLQKAFIKVSILWHSDPECHIRIETDTFGYTSGRIPS